ncbi:hypothetical protein VC87395_002251A, partial [Vibrio paracholerae 87395]
MASAMNNPSQI